jgi:hypothetical protein
VAVLAFPLSRRKQVQEGVRACVGNLLSVFWFEIFLRLKYVECIASGCFNTFVQ